MFFANIWRDVRYGVRQLLKTPVFTIVCVLTLALGVGANTAVFSVMHAVLIKMLPVEDASHVFYVHTTDYPAGASQTGDSNTSFSYPVYRALREQAGLQEVMTFIPLSTSGKAPARVGTVPEEAAGDMVSGNYFRGLGVGTELGRGFVEKVEDDHTPVVVISANFWATHYARSRTCSERRSISSRFRSPSWALPRGDSKAPKESCRWTSGFPCRAGPSSMRGGIRQRMACI
jgi:MacB-like periplasmic core domain